MKGNKLLIATIIIIVGFALSTAVNIVLYLQSQNADPLSRDLKSFTDEFGNVQIVSSSYGFTPPITMYHALKTGLENYCWKATDLQSMTVRIALFNGEFNDNRSLGSEIKLFQELKEPASSYAAVQDGTTVSRYFWEITVDKTEYLGVAHMPPAELFMVDAQTGELISHGTLY